jgi:hypothetical protein
MQKEIKINILIFLEDVVLLKFMKLDFSDDVFHSVTQKTQDGSIAIQESQKAQAASGRCALNT